MYYTIENEKMIIRPEGKIILDNSDVIKKQIKSLIDHHLFKSFALDLSRVEYVDSTGIGVFISIYKHLSEKEKSMVLIAPQPIVSKVIRITQLETIIPVFDNFKELESY